MIFFAQNVSGHNSAWFFDIVFLWQKLNLVVHILAAAWTIKVFSNFYIEHLSSKTACYVHKINKK